MKKILPSLTFIVIFSFSALAFESIPRQEGVLGGISLGASREYVKSVYGEPPRCEDIKNNNSGYGVTYNYNGTFKIHFWGSWGYNIDAYKVETTANNGIGTPSGIRVGMSASVLSNIYGAADYTESVSGITTKGYWADEWTVLKFGIVNGKIISITLERGC